MEHPIKIFFFFTNATCSQPLFFCLHCVRDKNNMFSPRFNGDHVSLKYIEIYWNIPGVYSPGNLTCLFWTHHFWGLMFHQYICRKLIEIRTNCRSLVNSQRHCDVSPQCWELEFYCRKSCLKWPAEIHLRFTTVHQSAHEIQWCWVCGKIFQAVEVFLNRIERTKLNLIEVFHVGKMFIC